MAIYNENGVPQLKLSSSSHEFVQGKHRNAIAAREALDPGEVTAEHEAEHLYIGTAVVVHNKAPKGAPDTEDVTVFSIGGSTLHEALTEVVGGFDQGHVQGGDHVNPPDWIASNDEDIARLLAEHYDCEIRDINEVF